MQINRPLDGNLTRVDEEKRRRGSKDPISRLSRKKKAHCRVTCSASERAEALEEDDDALKLFLIGEVWPRSANKLSHAATTAKGDSLKGV